MSPHIKPPSEADEPRVGTLRSVLNRWDPIGVYDPELDFPKDEYDCLIVPLLARIDVRDDDEAMRTFVLHELDHHFGFGTSPYNDQRVVRLLAALGESGLR